MQTNQDVQGTTQEEKNREGETDSDLGDYDEMGTRESN